MIVSPVLRARRPRAGDVVCGEGRAPDFRPPTRTGTEVETAINIARNELVTGATVLGYHHLTVCALGRPSARYRELRSRGNARAANLRHDRRARGHERRAVLLGATAGEFRLHRAPLPDFLPQLRRLRVAAQFRGRAEETAIAGDRRSPFWRRPARRPTVSISIVGKSAISR